MRLFPAHLYVTVPFLVLASCSGPAAYESFVKSSGTDRYGEYIFNLDMDDSLKRYSISFYTRIDTEGDSLQGDIPVSITAVSPSGKEYSDKVYIPEDAYGSHTAFSYQYEVSYRSGFVPVEYGKWSIAVSDGGYPGIRGMGIRLTAE